MRTTDKRVFWVDNIRGLMVLFVVCFHYIATPQIFTDIVYPVSLSFFFAFSGYFFKDSGDSFPKFFIKKLKAYFPILVAASVISCFLNGMTGESILVMLEQLAFQVYGCEILWFVACMLIVQLIMFVIVRVCRQNSLKVLFCCFIVFLIGVCWTLLFKIKLPWSIDIAFTQMLFLGIGYWYRSNREKADKCIKGWVVILCAFVYGTITVFFRHNDIHRREYSCIWLYYIQAVLGIIILTYIFKKWLNKKIPILNYLGVNSLYVYAFHGYALVVYNKLIGFIIKTQPVNESVLLTVGAAAFSAAAMIVFCKVWLKAKSVFKNIRNLPSPETKEKNRQLEGMRALALVLVLIYHFGYRYYEIYGGQTFSLTADFGVCGVAIFFIVSGFFATKLDAEKKTVGDTVISYFGKVVKLWLPYLCTITVTFVVTRFIELPSRTVDFSTYLLNIPLLNGFIGVSYVDAAHWYITQTLCFIFIVMFLEITRLNTKKAAYLVWLMAVIACFILSCFDFSGILGKLVGFARTVLGNGYAGAYIAGIMLRFIDNDKSVRQKCFTMIITMLACAVFTYDFGLIAGAAFIVARTMIYFAIRQNLKFLEWKPLVFIGSISYGAYLIHQNIGYIFILNMPDIIGITVAIAVAVAIGVLLTELKSCTDVFVNKAVKYIQKK